MVWCSFCAKNVVGYRPNDSQLWCPGCGKLLEELYFSTEATFVKNSNGQSQLSGNYVRTIQSDTSLSRERSLENAKDEMRYMRDFLGMGDNEDIIKVASAFYTIAVERNFTRGRHGKHVQASCLYIACREKEKPYLLIDFSNYLQISVYVLGAVFLQLCKVLRLEEHPIVQKLVDPSLFIHKFTECLFGKKIDAQTKKVITKTSLHIVASMKRDWMQTGRKPSGLCGAAIYISALANGLKCTKLDIIRVVHICDATLTKRLVEFENTESGSLTIEEFIERAEELVQSGSTKQPAISKGSGAENILCEHTDEKHFAHGLCKDCYDKFIEISGGISGGADPPAFQRAEKARLAQLTAKENAIEIDKESSSQDASKDKESESHSRDPESICAAAEPAAVEAHNHKSQGVDCDSMPTETNEESDNFSDIDEDEVDGYLHNEEEKNYKKIIWEEMNKEYVEEQAAKEAALAAAKEALQASFKGRPDLQAAHELAAAAEAAVAKARQEKRQKRAAEARNTGPAKSAAEATRQMLAKKRLDSKINFDVLNALFEKDSEATENPPKKPKVSEPVKNTKTKTSKLDPLNENNDEGDAGVAYDGEENQDEYNYVDYENQEYYEDYGYGEEYE